MKAVILAAGTGSRLKEITQARTKGMVPVSGKKLIDHLFSFMNFDLFEEIIVVGGFCYEDLKEHIAEMKYSKVRVIENSEYLKGNIFTLLTALKEFNNDSFLITNVDHIYPGIMFDKMAESFSGIRAMCDFDRDLGMDDMKVKLNSDKSVSKISKQLDEFDCGYIGMTFVHKDCNELYRKSAEEAVEKYGEKAVVENILQIIAEKDNEYPLICDLSGFGWYEVDDASDLAKAEAGLKVDPNFTA